MRALVLTGAAWTRKREPKRRRTTRRTRSWKPSLSSTARRNSWLRYTSSSCSASGGGSERSPRGANRFQS
eukprot:1409600-Rhodomonas_salina.1